MILKYEDFICGHIGIHCDSSDAARCVINALQSFPLEWNDRPGKVCGIKYEYYKEKTVYVCKHGRLDIESIEDCSADTIVNISDIEAIQSNAIYSMVCKTESTNVDLCTILQNAISGKYALSDNQEDFNALKNDIYSAIKIYDDKLYQLFDVYINYLLSIPELSCTNIASKLIMFTNYII